MFRLTAPVIKSPSAWRGDATNWIPKRPRSKTTVLSTFTSASQPLPPPALTCRSLSERPNRRRARASSASASRSVRLSVIRSSRRRVASRQSEPNAIAPSGHASTHSVQNKHRPRSMRSPESSAASACVGHASTHARQPSGQRVASSAGAPRKRSGNSGAASGNAIVRVPCRTRVCRIFHIVRRSLLLLEIEATVREVEALVAERKVGDRLAAQRDREPDPVVERRIDDLVAGDRAGLIGADDVADLSAPSLYQRDADRARREWRERPAQRSGWKLVQLLRHE